MCIRDRGEIIYNDLKIAKLKKTKKGSLATSAKILEDLALTGHKFPNLVLEWRQVSKLKSTPNLFARSKRERVI